MKVRCSAIGKIMTSPKTKGEVLSKTTKTFIEERFLENELCIYKDFSSKHTRKGIECEKEGIALANEVLGWGLDFDYIEFGGQEFYENDFITGHTDVSTDSVLADIKVSFSGTSFPFFMELEDIPKDYYYQLQGYMWLTGKQVSTLAYCLINTPEKQVLDEIRAEYWKQGVIDEDLEVEEFIRSKHNFDRFPKTQRVKAFLVERNDSVIEKIKERVIECTQYYNSLFKKFNV
jgi:hypothetical protein